MRPHDDGRGRSHSSSGRRGFEPLTVYGDGSQSAGVLLRVDDLIEGIIRLFERGGRDPTNTRQPDEFTVRQLAERVLT